MSKTEGNFKLFDATYILLADYNLLLQFINKVILILNIPIILEFKIDRKNTESHLHPNLILIGTLIDQMVSQVSSNF